MPIHSSHAWRLGAGFDENEHDEADDMGRFGEVLWSSAALAEKAPRSGPTPRDRERGITREGLYN